MCICIYIYVYIHIHTYVYTHVYVYTHIYLFQQWFEEQLSRVLAPQRYFTGPDFPKTITSWGNDFQRGSAVPDVDSVANPALLWEIGSRRVFAHINIFIYTVHTHMFIYT